MDGFIIMYLWDPMNSVLECRNSTSGLILDQILFFTYMLLNCTFGTEMTFALFERIGVQHEIMFI